MGVCRSTASPAIQQGRVCRSRTTSYLYDVNGGLPTLLEDGAIRYVWGLGLAYATIGTALSVYHVDGLGSVRAITG